MVATETNERRPNGHPGRTSGFLVFRLDANGRAAIGRPPFAPLRLELALVVEVDRPAGLAGAVVEAEALVERAGRPCRPRRSPGRCSRRRARGPPRALAPSAPARVPGRAARAPRTARRGSTRGRASRSTGGSAAPPARPGRRPRAGRPSRPRRSARPPARPARSGPGVTSSNSVLKSCRSRPIASASARPAWRTLALIRSASRTARRTAPRAARRSPRPPRSRRAGG